jgi:valyl-tRNA synthetase
MQMLQELISAIRDERKNKGIPEKETVPILLVTEADRKFGVTPEELFKRNGDMIRRLGRVSEITISDRRTVGSENQTWRSLDFADFAVVHEREVDLTAERERLTKDIARYEKGLAAAERQLGNEGFLAKAPAHVVEGLKKQEAETRLLLEKARAALNALPEQ